MVLTKEEFIESLKNEVRILLHLTTKIDRAKLDYRPTAKQRSTIELLRYMTFMGPFLIRSIKAGAFDPPAWNAAAAVADASDFDAVVAQIGRQSEDCPQLLAGFSEDDLRAEIEMFGQKTTRGSALVNTVLSAYAAYRTQLFLYLKACGREELNTMNLWVGVDGPM